MGQMKNPPHPGEILRHEIIEGHALTVTESAKVLGVTRQALNNLVNGGSSLTPEMALRFEKAFGVSMDTLMRMQTSYDIAQMRKRTVSIKVKPFQEGKTRSGMSAEALA